MKQVYSMQIKKYDPNRDLNVESRLKSEIQAMDVKISRALQELSQAQLIRFKSFFSNRNDFIMNIQKKIYERPLDQSIKWHQDQLKNLYLERQRLQTKYEKVTGKFWINRLKRIAVLLSFSVFILLLILVFFSGIITMIYLAPIWICILCFYFLLKKRNQFY